MIITILIMILLIVGAFSALKQFKNRKELKEIFFRNNVIVFGKKGTGKDVLFNYITNTRKEYYANIPYTNPNYELITPNDLKLSNNTFESLLLNNINKCNWNYKENVDFFISDCGVYLPSQYDSILHKQYKGLPLFYALSRHIGCHNIHINTQALDRVWKVLREQADIYIKTIDTIKLPFFLKLKYRVYDKYTSALNDIRPITNNKLFGSSDSLKIQSANVGYIKESSILLSKRKCKYDSRYFKKIFVA